jgi:hypothetical protein
MKSWRSAGGEPDIGLDLLAWLPAEGFELRSVQTFSDALTPRDFAWHWPKTFVSVGLDRLVDLGEMTREEANHVRDEFAILETTPHVRMITPPVVEMIAIKR